MKVIICAVFLVNVIFTQASLQPSTYPARVPRPDTILINRPIRTDQLRIRRDATDNVEADFLLRSERSLQPQRNPTFPRPDMILINRPTMPKDLTRFRRDVAEQEPVNPEITLTNVEEPEEITREKRSSVRAKTLIYRRPRPNFLPPVRIARAVDDDSQEFSAEVIGRQKRAVTKRPPFMTPVRIARDVDDSQEFSAEVLGREKRSRWQKPWSPRPRGGTRRIRDVDDVDADVASDEPLAREKRSRWQKPWSPRPRGGTRNIRGVDMDSEVASDAPLTREKRWAPNNNGNHGAGQQGDRGSWGVSVNKDKGRGPQVRTEAQGNVYSSPNGNVRVDAQGHHEFGKGRKPDYGGSVKVQGRWRRDADDDMDEVERVRRQASNDRGSVSVTVNKDKGSGPQVRTEGQVKAWESKNGNWQVNGGAFHEAGRGRKPSYGGGVSVTGRFRRALEDLDSLVLPEDDDQAIRERREANPQEKRGSVTVTADHQHGRGPQIRTDAQYRAWQSRNGNWQLNGQGFHQAGRGQKPSYGAGVSLTGRFRRDVEDEDIEEFVEVEDESAGLRERREANPQEKKGSVTVTADHQHGRGPQIRTDAQYKAWQSRNGNWQLHGQGFHQAGRGQKPSYGGGVSLTGRF